MVLPKVPDCTTSGFARVVMTRLCTPAAALPPAVAVSKVLSDGVAACTVQVVARARLSADAFRALMEAPRSAHPVFWALRRPDCWSTREMGWRSRVISFWIMVSVSRPLPRPLRRRGSIGLTSERPMVGAPRITADRRAPQAIYLNGYLSNATL